MLKYYQQLFHVFVKFSNMFYDVVVTWKLWATLKADIVAAKTFTSFLQSLRVRKIAWIGTHLLKLHVVKRDIFVLKTVAIHKNARCTLMPSVFTAKQTPSEVKQYRLCKVPFVLNGTNEIVFYDSFPENFSLCSSGASLRRTKYGKPCEGINSEQQFITLLPYWSIIK